MKKLFACVMFSTLVLGVLSAFEEGWAFNLKANVGGSLTMPSISASDLDKLGASYMKGGMGYIGGAEVEIGYMFGSSKWFNLDPSTFSGVSAYGSVGISTGHSTQVAGNTIEGETVNMHITVEFLPVISLGVGGKAFFLNNRVSAGLWLGTKIIADTSPAYLAYSDHAQTNENAKLPEMGEIIVDDFMMKNMNPFMFSSKLMLEYYQPINENVRLVLGGYFQFNLYSPKYITMPESLMKLIEVQRPEFSSRTPLSSYFLNSMDFGASVALSFKV